MGQIRIDVPDELHETIRRIAAEADETEEEVVVSLLGEAVSDAGVLMALHFQPSGEV